MSSEPGQRDQPGGFPSADEIYAKLKDHAVIGIIDFVRPASTSGRVLSING